MKIITWNCNMAFRKKYQAMIQHSPDVLLIQECECKDKLEPTLNDVGYNKLICHGDNQHKGIAVLTFNAYHVSVHPAYDPQFKYIVPLIVSSKSSRIHLFSIWAMPHNTIRAKDYVGQIWGAIQYYDDLFTKDTILAGDFNSNAIWDSQRKQGNHSDVVQYLKEKNIISTYHTICNIKHGAEPDPTLYLLKQKQKPYHLDYCFVSKSMLTPQTTISVGTYPDWIHLSDHMPLIVDNLRV